MRITAALALALLVVGCSSEAVVVGPTVPVAEAPAEPGAPADANPTAAVAPSAAPTEEPVAAPVEPAVGLVEPEAQSDLQIAAAMTSALRTHRQDEARKRAEQDAAFKEMMSKPFGGFGSDDIYGGRGGLGTTGSGVGGGGSTGWGMGGGGGAIGTGGGGSGAGIGTGSLGSGGGSKPKTPPKKPAKPKTPPKK